MHDVRKAARILRLGLPETELIQVIREGPNPQERSRLVFSDPPRCFADLDRWCAHARRVQANDESRGRAAKDVQYSSGLLGRAKKDKYGGWRGTQETVRKTEYSGSNGGYKGVASEKTVTTATAQKRNKYEFNRGRRNYVREQTSASREPVPCLLYTSVPTRVVSERNT